MGKSTIPADRYVPGIGWHPQQVHRLLSNEKYIGRWTWGRTATLRDSQGRKKQTPVPPGQEVSRDRPDLRIIDQGVWDQAATRLAELNETFGHKDGQSPRGPKPNPAAVYPRSSLGGLLACGKCGAKMWQHYSNKRRYYACPGTKKGVCDVAAQVPADRAEGGLTAFLLDVLRGWPEWMRAVYRLTCEAIRTGAERVPADRDRDARRAADLDRQIGNLVTALAEGGLVSPAVTARLRAAEVERRLAGYAGVGPASVALPEEAWVAAQLGAWAGAAAAADGPGSLLRLALATVAAEPVIAPGKKRGFVRLRFRVNAWNTLAAVVGDSWPAAVRELLPPPTAGGDSPEFVFDLGEPSKLDRWAPQIAAWRADGVTWEEIVRRPDMDLSRVYVAWRRYTGATGEAPPAA